MKSSMEEKDFPKIFEKEKSEILSTPNKRVSEDGKEVWVWFSEKIPNYKSQIMEGQCEEILTDFTDFDILARRSELEMYIFNKNKITYVRCPSLDTFEALISDTRETVIEVKNLMEAMGDRLKDCIGPSTV